MRSLLTQFTITDVAPGYWRVTFNNPPLNFCDPDTLIELQQIATLIESDDALRVVVFDSDDQDFFVNHYDVSRVADFPLQPGPTGLPTFIDATTRLTTSPVVTIASIRGRTRGGGSEIALACDMRFASLERAIFAQIEVGAGVFPGGGATERLPLLVGRARALEIVLGSDDFDAATAALYGWVNRALPDNELDAFVDNLARRIASFDKPALAEAKGLINRRTLPSAEDLMQTQEVFLNAFSWPTVHERGARIAQKRDEVGADFEARMGYHLGNLRTNT
ncbi:MULTISPECIES: enoyl-CoA hydratase/isomerase family protein [Pseudomonas]|uniref:Enoyl-CoA hydratase/isomerase n=5 Tax=Pseudomonas TaxID=286 RepID=A0A3M5X500_9PSED|nr:MULTISPECIES: enoyl-CoA hydratase/isomerase family protein [Pseudomonas]MCW6058151.1 enoyl-CoA hydratase/isomerase family protein [Pseudomonas fragi]AAY35804.1 Enoyl-CoA hydratase/isomerase [Pseudomonas syringae pv. syringae B728a]AVB24342.1 enoyl-CoA hydratase/isomerase family protein [Pseudomonas syringae pv. syringae]EGH71970.1 enoyl-CoA hydratase/isomerase [Pseudomonas syringae pv. aceris str. M302273]KOG02721.1 Enoyl-CoA hydratase/isomerase [Pseudomonas syringae pv. aceris]